MLSAALGDIEQVHRSDGTSDDTVTISIADVVEPSSDDKIRIQGGAADAVNKTDTFIRVAHRSGGGALRENAHASRCDGHSVVEDRDDRGIGGVGRLGGAWQHH